jgi:hypothetical protein
MAIRVASPVSHQLSCRCRKCRKARAMEARLCRRGIAILQCGLTLMRVLGSNAAPHDMRLEAPERSMRGGFHGRGRLARIGRSCTRAVFSVGRCFTAESLPARDQAGKASASKRATRCDYVCLRVTAAMSQATSQPTIAQTRMRKTQPTFVGAHQPQPHAPLFWRSPGIPML